MEIPAGYCEEPNGAEELEPRAKKSKLITKTETLTEWKAKYGSISIRRRR